MGFQINTNMGALNAYRNLSNTQNDLNKSLEKLSSGFRINRAADDAAGLAISEGLRSQVGGLKVAARNAQDGISVVQTAEGALGEVHSILQRLRDLAVQAGNDSNNGAARDNIKKEADGLTSELSRISDSTNFNGISLLKGDVGNGGTGLSFQVGAGASADNQIVVDLAGADVSAIAANLNFGTTTVQNASGNVATATAVEGSWEFSQGGTTVAVDMGAAGGLNTTQDVVNKLNSDAGFATNFRADVDKDGALVVTSKSSGNDAIALAAGAGGDLGGTTLAAGTTTLGFDSAAAAKASITAIDEQIAAVSTARADLGAVQNRFESAIKTISVATENLTASESRIRDTDIAQEMVSFTRAQILSQAGTAMLAQAKSAPQSVLQRLQ
ncbi:MAG: flagellin [Microbacteriaceae bacterium]